jgi:3-dehydroquinate synthase
MGVKNLIGAFHQPRAVVIDPDLLSTLSFDQLTNGMAEAVKMALCFDPALISELEAASDPYSPAMLERVIIASLHMKKHVVEQDERESGLRRVLNFGHTLGHGIEGMGQKGHYVGDHGHCVALGMLPMCEDEALRARVRALLDKLHLPTVYEGELDGVMELVMQDKKKVENGIVCVVLTGIGRFSFVRMGEDELRCRMKEAFA